MGHPDCDGALRHLRDSSTATRPNTRLEAIMSRHEGETGTPSSEYLTVPELATMVRRNRKTVYGWIATGEIGEADGLFQSKVVF